MSDNERKIYLKIRAEQIKMQHDLINKQFFPNGYIIASEQLETIGK